MGHSRTTPQFQTVCEVSDVPVGEARMFVVNETMIGLFRVDGEFFALSDRCPHAGASLSRGYVECGVVSCRIHLWRFRIRDGKNLDEQNPTRNARTYPVRVVGQKVQVAV